MSRAAAALTFLCAALPAIAHAQGVPATVAFAARLADRGAPVTGAHELVVTLFDTATGGVPLWSEMHGSDVADGMVYLTLGTKTSLDAAVFSGAPLFLEVAVDGTTLTPRLAITSVPYAIRAGVASSADTLGGHSPDDFVTNVSAGSGLAGGGTGDVALAVDPALVQSRVTGSCAPGSMIRAIHPDGTVTCGIDTSGSGDVTAVVAGGGLVGGGTAGDVTLAADTGVLQSRVSGACAPGSSIRTIASDGTVTCEPDDAPTYSAGPGLRLTGNAFAVDLPMAAGRNSALLASGLNFIGAVPPYQPAAPGRCFVSATVSESASAPGTGGNFWIMARVNGADDLPVAGIPIPLDPAERNGSASMSWVWDVTPASAYEFGCGVVPGAGFVGASATCRVAYLCN